MAVPSLFAAWSLIAVGSLLLLVGLGAVVRFRWRLNSGCVLPGRVLRLVEVRTPQGWMSAASVSFQIDDRTAVVEGRGTRWPDMKAGDRASVYIPADDQAAATVLRRSETKEKEYAAGLIGMGLLILLVGVAVILAWSRVAL